MEFIQQFTKELFDKLGFNVTVDIEERDDTIYINLSGDDLGGVIGHHGETLNNLQYIISLANTQKNGEFKRVILDAGDWRKHREDQLKDMADHGMDRVDATQRDYHFPPLNAFERRIIHEYLSQEKDYITESEGEGRERHIVLKKA